MRRTSWARCTARAAWRESPAAAPNAPQHTSPTPSLPTSPVSRPATTASTMKPSSCSKCAEAGIAVKIVILSVLKDLLFPLCVRQRNPAPYSFSPCRSLLNLKRPSGDPLHTAAQERIIHPARNLIGSLRLPGDKSISHRYGMLAAFAEGTSHFSNFSTGADCASTLACMQALGATVARQDDGVVAVTGVGGRVTPSSQPLDCGNSGSTMRMMSGLLAPQQGTFTLIGDASLSRRPMERIRKPLEQMGARLSLSDGHAPIIIEGGPLAAIDYTTPT